MRKILRKRKFKKKCRESGEYIGEKFFFFFWKKTKE